MNIDEAKLTAYILEEIKDPEERSAIETALEADPDLRIRAEELRDLQNQLGQAFAAEEFVTTEFSGLPATFPHLNGEGTVKTAGNWLPWLSGIAASLAIIFAFFLIDFKEPEFDESSSITVSNGLPSSVDLEDLDLSMIRSQLLGPGATWSDSQVLANSPFFKSVSEPMILPRVWSERVFPIEDPSLASDSFYQVFHSPHSWLPVFWDALGMTRLELSLGRGELPAPKEVDIESIINAFSYKYSSPDSLEEPFSVHMEQSESPWQSGQTLLRVGLQGHDKALDLSAHNNYVFLVDVSGSMDEVNKLPLVKAGITQVAEKMKPRDRLAIVTYGASSEVYLPSSYGLDREKIRLAISELEPGVSISADGGALEAYRIAADVFMDEGQNRIIVCTDGDAQLGVRDTKELEQTIQSWAERGLLLSVYGFGVGSSRQADLEKLAAFGGGHMGYVDGPLDVTRAFSARLTGEFLPIASDVRLEVEFNPERVDAYRLIGYEDRGKVDVSPNVLRPDNLDVPAGHTMTALYELIPSDVREDPKSHGAEIASKTVSEKEIEVQELVTVRVHYQPEGRSQEELIEVLFSGESSPFEEASEDMRFAAAVSGFGQILRNSPYKGDVDFNWVLLTAGGAVGDNPGGTRTQFLEMVRQAEAITNSDYSAAEN